MRSTSALKDKTRAPEPPFTLRDLRRAIPDACFRPSTTRSLAHLFFDIAVIGALYFTAIYLDDAYPRFTWYWMPLFWFAQGTMFWALFVVGHDCGHGSFSRRPTLNNFIGHVCHAPILVPYHGWRISHRIHHNNTGNVEHDETWYPFTRKEHGTYPAFVRILRFKLFPLLFPFYLIVVRRSPTYNNSHFLPSSDLFQPSERKAALASSLSVLLVLGALVGVGWFQGFLFVLKFYIVPYIVFVCWLDIVTYLHHTDRRLPWYRGEGWTFLKGALSTMDRDYGRVLNFIHHDIGTHVAHHLFIGIPHYHLRTATAAIKDVLGEYYNRSDESIARALVNSVRDCRFVEDEGTMVHYKPKSELNS